jgi:CysZ protein
VHSRSRPSALVRFLTGAGYFWRGFAFWGTRPSLMALGAVPALVVGALVVAALVALGFVVDDLVVWLTPFADTWTDALRDTVRLAGGVAVMVAALLLVVVTFTALTLAVGDPIYERIWLRAERDLGEFVGPVELPFWAGIGRAAGSGLRLVGFALVAGIVVFVLGLIPVAGAVLGPVCGWMVGGWAIARELLSRPVDARNIDRRTEAAMRKADRPLVLGFGLMVYVLFLVPFAAIVAMPAAVVGSTLLFRRLSAPFEIRRPDRE